MMDLFKFQWMIIQNSQSKITDRLSTKKCQKISMTKKEKPTFQCCLHNKVMAKRKIPFLAKILIMEEQETMKRIDKLEKKGTIQNMPGQKIHV